jgi:hypothetical protein
MGPMHAKRDTPKKFKQAGKRTQCLFAIGGPRQTANEGSSSYDLVRLCALRLALQPQRSQPVHIFDRRLVPGMLLLQRAFDLRLTALVFIENSFGCFAVFCAHNACF